MSAASTISGSPSAKDDVDLIVEGSSMALSPSMMMRSSLASTTRTALHGMVGHDS